MISFVLIRLEISRLATSLYEARKTLGSSLQSPGVISMGRHESQAEERHSTGSQCSLYASGAGSDGSTSLYAICNDHVAPEDGFALAAKLMEHVSPTHVLVETSITVPKCLPSHAFRKPMKILCSKKSPFAIRK